MTAGKIAHSAQHLAEYMVGAGAAPGAGTAGDGTTTAIKVVVTATLPTAGANVSSTVNVTVNGAALGDIVLVGGPIASAVTHQLTVVGFVSAADTITLSCQGDTTGFTGASKTYNVIILKQS